MRGRSIFAPDRLENGATYLATRAAAGSLQIVHSLSGGQRPRTPNSISLFIETLGARQGRRECRFRLFLGAFDRGRRRLGSSCAPIDCGAIGPAFGFPADWRTACSNCAILLLQGPACAAATPRPRAAETSKVAEGRLMTRRRICEHLHDVFDRALPRFPARRRPDVRQGSVTSAGSRAACAGDCF